MTKSLRQIYLPSGNSAVGIQADDLVYVAGLTSSSRSHEVTLDGVRGQTREAIAYMQSLLATAGGSPANLARVTGYVRDASEQREAVYDVWDLVFPDAADKPAFKILDAPLPEGVLVSFDFLALLGHTRRRVDIPGVDARDPTVRIGSWVLTSRLHGTAPQTGQTVEGLDAQARQALLNGIRLVELAGGSRADVTEICGFGRDLSYVATLRRVIEQEFAGGAHQPSFQPLTTFVRPVLEVMVELTACLPGQTTPTDHIALGRTRTPCFQ
jgi:2-iminobutanoate/2-iminopropanoate deaminase